MNVSDSDLFKEFARPSLQYAQTNNIWGALRPSRAMDSVVQYLMSLSSLEVLLVKIDDATEDSYAISMETRVTGTGPVSSTVSAMEVNLTFDGHCFSTMCLPELCTSWWGTDIVVRDQRVKITDMAAYKDYVRSVISSEDTGFKLENGGCTISALGLSVDCNYNLDVPLKGMGGLKGAIKNIERKEGAKLMMTVILHNPSPVEIDHGMSLFELRNPHKGVLATLKGGLKILRGDFDVMLEGELLQGAVETKAVTLAGIGVEGNTWCSETIKFIQPTMELTSEQWGVLFS
ncbi:hypothetical protein HJFPF1_06458 [Paramyrothecium foliicola]|nr:hypothetical protein HJFPF1_06458 [Paramyrothecium foliicola]